MTIAKAIEVLEGQLPELTVAPDARPQGTRPSKHVYADVGLEGWRAFKSGRTNHTNLFVFEIVLPEPQTVKSDKKRNEALEYARTFCDWLKAQNDIGGMLPYRMIPIEQSIEEVEETNKSTTIILRVMFHLCEEYPDGGG